jgi:hypothetical protein
VRAWELLPAEDPGHGIGPVIDEFARLSRLSESETTT